jgi:hypothetical protein
MVTIFEFAIILSELLVIGTKKKKKRESYEVYLPY